LLIALGVLIAFYVVLHLLIPGVREPLSVTLVTLVAGAEQQAANVEDLSQSAELSVAIADIGAGLETLLAQTPDLNDADREILRATLTGIQAAIAENRKADALAGLATLRRLVGTPSPLGFVIWSREPLRFLEVFLWGLAGVLVNKIITVGWYLRNQRFYREGIVMHIANIATAPLLALVTLFLLSLVTLQVTLAGSNEVTVDLSDPHLLAAVSFLLGSQPWSLWDFLGETARRFTGRQD
jgi:hypothetical protein